MQRDFAFVNIRHVLRTLSRVHPCPVYQYYFTEPILLQDGTFVGATHSAELFYVFGTLDVLGSSTVEGSAMDVKRAAAVCAFSADGPLLGEFLSAAAT